MPVFTLTDEIIFPPVELAERNGVLAVGGDLSIPRLIDAYSHGIFPWYSDDEPIVWWSPDPRFVLFPQEITVSKSMRQVMNRKIFTIKYDTCFREVMTECGNARRNGPGTWITDEMLEAYVELHNEGLAHSVEAWKEGRLAGGLYGVSLGGCFYGESMFAHESNASKACLVDLARRLQDLNFLVIDCQVYTNHLASMGARHIPRKEFIGIIKNALGNDTLKGNWGTMPLFAATND